MHHEVTTSPFVRRLVILGTAGIVAALLLFAYLSSQAAPQPTPSPSPSATTSTR